MLRQKGPSLRSEARTAGRWRNIPENQEQSMPPESQVLRLRSGRQRSEDRGPVAQHSGKSGAGHAARKSGPSAALRTAEEMKYFPKGLTNDK